MGRWRTVVARRRILALLIARDLKVKYSDSALGYLWTVLEPLLMGVTYWFVFTRIFPRVDIAPQPYIVFLLIGLLSWGWASQVITSCPRSIAGEARLVRSVDVPREIWVLRTVGTKFFEFVFAIPVIVAFLIVLQHPVNWRLVFIPVAMGLQWVVLVGIALILAPATVMMTDIERFIKIVVRMGLYMCPVIYSSDRILNNPMVPEFVKVAYEINPFHAILGLYRAGIFASETPSLGTVLQGSAVCFLMLGIGLYVFRRLEPAVLKEI